MMRLNCLSDPEKSSLTHLIDSALAERRIAMRAGSGHYIAPEEAAILFLLLERLRAEPARVAL